MSALDEVRERDAKYTVLDMKWSGTPEATRDCRFLLSQLDALQAALQSERDENFALHLTCSQLGDERDVIKAAVKAAGPALEAGIRELESAAEYFGGYSERKQQCAEQAKELRTLVAQLRAVLSLCL